MQQKDYDFLNGWIVKELKWISENYGIVVGRRETFADGYARGVSHVGQILKQYWEDQKKLN